MDGSGRHELYRAVRPGLLTPPADPRLAVPLDLPLSPLNGVTLRAFNTAYFHQLGRSGRRAWVGPYEPVLYPLDSAQISAHHKVVDLIHWGNPLSPAIQALRDPLFYGRLPRLADVVYVIVASVVALALGAFVFTRVDDQIAVEV